MLGDTIGPFDVPTGYEEGSFKVRHGDKSKLYGAALVACGSTPGNISEAELKADDVKLGTTSSEPCSYHGRSPQLWEELARSYGIEAWLDLTASDGTLCG